MIVVPEVGKPSGIVRALVYRIARWPTCTRVSAALSPLTSKIRAVGAAALRLGESAASVDQRRPSSDSRNAQSVVRSMARHRPERTLLYRLAQEYYPALRAHLAAQGTALPAYVEREFEDYLRCGRLEHGFMRVGCDSCHGEQLVAFSCKRRGSVQAVAPGA